MSDIADGASRSEHPSPTRSGVSPSAVRSFRSRLTVGDDVVHPSTGYGGYNEDHEFFRYRQSL
jgi:hypothetical protein